MYRTLDDLAVKGKRVLVRADLNAPMKDGRVTDTLRIKRQAPTIKELADKGARVIVLSHFGRPKGKPNQAMSLKPVVAPLTEALGRPVAFTDDCVGTHAVEAVAKLKDGEVLLLENTRFHAGEEANNEDFAERLADLGDLYVNDAFSAAHRAHASTERLAHLLPAAAGRSMQAELQYLEKTLLRPEHPVMAIVGGAKVSTKIALLKHLIAKVDVLVIGGGMANTFLAAQGHEVGTSLCERDQTQTARDISKAGIVAGAAILLPLDMVVAKEFKAQAPSRVVGVDGVAKDEMILDVGPVTIEALSRRLQNIRTVVWNGPFGAFELPPFDAGTRAAARLIADATQAGKLLSIAGGGDTVSALAEAGVDDKFTYVSTAGGAFLEWLEGQVLPGVAALESASTRTQGR